MEKRPHRVAAQLTFRLLGPPTVLWADRPLTLARRQARALLYRLAAGLDPVSRETLCFLFWPDIPDPTARRHLTRLLAHLHADLPEPAVLVADRDMVWLDRERVDSDVESFRRFSADPGGAPLGRLQQAIDLYRGPFLSGFSLPGAPEFESWTFLEQQNLEQLYLAVLSAAVDRLAAGHAYREAIALVHRYLATDNLVEDMHRRLIELSAAAGDRTAAVRHYEILADLLERELGVEPLPETQAVYQAALHNRPPQRHPEVRQPAAPRPAPEGSLVGREEEWKALAQLWAEVQEGEGRVVLIAGEPGIGKTRLMRGFAQQSGALSLLALCYRSTQATPYLPLVDALRPYLPDRSFARRIEPVWLAEAARLLPELQRAGGDLPQPEPAYGDEARIRLFEALRRLLLGLSPPGSAVLLCMDDLHWADQATLDWLAYLGHHLQETPILVIGSYRTEEAGPLRDLRRELAQDRALVELSLTALSTHHVLTLLEQLAGTPSVSPALAHRLWTATGGNPFFLVETIHMLLGNGQLDPGPLGTGQIPLPGSVLDAVRARVSRLTPTGQQVLAAGAVLGTGFSFGLLKETAGRSDEETVDALDELVASNLLDEEENGNGYRFRHELIQVAVSQDLSLRRRQLLHRRAAIALESDLPTRAFPDDRRAARLGYHYAEAGEARPAATYLLQAGDQARNLYAHKEAIAHYRRALPFLEQIGDDAQRARTLMKLGLAYHNAFDFSQARQAYEEGLAQWQRVAHRQRARDPHVTPAPHALRVAWHVPHVLDPAYATDTLSGAVTGKLFPQLARLSPELDVVPDAAKTWEVLADGHTYVFHLREDIKWSDGTPLTAGDFEYAWKRMFDPKMGSENAQLLYEVRGVRAFHEGRQRDAGRIGIQAVDPVTLRMELDKPASYFPYLVAHGATSAIPRHHVEEYGATWADAANLIGCGSFQVETFRPGEFLSLVQNRNYHWPATGNVQRVELYRVDDPQAILEMYEDGALDVVALDWLRPMHAVEHARQRHAGEYLSFPWLRSIYVLFDTQVPPFDDPRVRRAFALALDREQLANVVLRGYQFPGTGGLVPPGMPGHSPEIGLCYDPDAARRLLAAAGYQTGQAFPAIRALSYRAGFFAAVRDWLQAAWERELGVEVSWEERQWAQLPDRSAAERYPLILGGWVADFPDPDNVLRVGLAEHPGLWQGTTFSRQVNRARQFLSQPERLQAYQDADRRLIEEALVVPLVYGRQHLLVKPWIRRFPVSPNSWWFWEDVVIEPH